MLGPKLVSKKIYVKKNVGSQIIWVKQNFGPKNILGQTIFWSKKLGCPKNSDQKRSKTAEIFLYGQMLPGQMLPG